MFRRVHMPCGCTPLRCCLLLICGIRALAGLVRSSTYRSIPFDGSEAAHSAALTFNVSHLPIALAISGAAEIGTSKTAAAGSAEHDAVAAANKLRTAIVDGLAVDRHKAEPTGGAAAKSRGGDLGALDDKQRGDIVIAFDVDRDILAEPATVSSVAARAFAQPLVAEEDRVVALGNLDQCRRDVGWPRQATDTILVGPRPETAIEKQYRREIPPLPPPRQRNGPERRAGRRHHPLRCNLV